jgi:beta-N-acetylhexosaminidase
LTLSLQKEAKDAGHAHPLFIGIDQENGLVTRITPPIAAQQPGQMALGATQSSSNAYEVGKATGEMLDFFGINMNYAPDCDVNSEPLNPVIGVRSAGDNPNFVGRIASATASGLRDGGVVPTVKHFPGHGDTAVDSHHGLPVITKSRSELERCELIPFRRVVAQGIEAVMTAHIALPKINSSPETKGLPATLSTDALGILRNDMKYDGVVVTDCLEMDGIRATYGTVEGSLMSLKAGSDSVMICHTYDVQVKSIKRVFNAVQAGELPESRIDEALRRVTALKQKFLTWEHALRVTPDLSLTDLAIMNERHEKFAKKVYSESTTVMRNDLKVLPISSDASKVLLLTPGGKVPVGGAVDESGPKHLTYLDVLKEATSNKSSVMEILYPETGLLSDEQWQVIEKEADVVIMATRNAKEAEGQRKLGLQLAKVRPDLILIAACNPYDFIDDVDNFKTYIAIYEPTVEAFSSAVDIIYGKAAAKGKLPVASKPDQLDKTYEIKPLIDGPDKAIIIEGITKVWSAAFPDYKLPQENLVKVIDQSHGQHFIAQERRSGEIVGFCLAYTSIKRGKQSAQIAVHAVHPAKQGQGIGSRLLADAREYFYEHYGLTRAPLRSYFPRFWPGFPADLSPATQQFFVNRGYRLTDSNGSDRASSDAILSADLFQDIRNFKSPQKYLDRAAAAGVTYRAITSETFEDCLAGQKRNFTHYTVSNPEYLLWKVN